MTLRDAAQATADNLECVCHVTKHPPCHVCALRSALSLPDPGGWAEGARATQRAALERLQSLAITQRYATPGEAWLGAIYEVGALALPVPPATTAPQSGKVPLAECGLFPGHLGPCERAPEAKPAESVEVWADPNEFEDRWFEVYNCDDVKPQSNSLVRCRLTVVEPAPVEPEETTPTEPPCAGCGEYHGFRLRSDGVHTCKACGTERVEPEETR